jgi:hypothetical protein
MTQKETLWINIYTETIKRFSPIKAESAATKAVEAFEKRFPDKNEYDLFKEVLHRFDNVDCNIIYTNDDQTDVIDLYIRSKCAISFAFDSGNLVSIGT